MNRVLPRIAVAALALSFAFVTPTLFAAEADSCLLPFSFKRTLAASPALSLEAPAAVEAPAAGFPRLKAPKSGKGDSALQSSNCMQNCDDQDSACHAYCDTLPLGQREQCRSDCLYAHDACYCTQCGISGYCH